jgi:hypothetical protein
MEYEITAALAEISSTTDLLERSLKLAGLLTSMFGKRGFPLVVVGGSAVEFYTEGGYMSGDIDLCRTTLKAIPPRLMQEVVSELGGEGVARSWRICGLYVDMLGFLESETVLPFRELETPYGIVRIIPPELALVERVLVAYFPPSEEALATAKKMMSAALADATFNWDEARRLAALPSFDVAKEMESLRLEVGNG